MIHQQRDIPMDDERRTDSQEIGLIAGMMDGYIEQFGFRGLIVQRRGEAMQVRMAENAPVLGGRMDLRGASLEEAHDWLAMKAELYAEPTYPR